jgi:hypothetical protein
MANKNFVTSIALLLSSLFTTEILGDDQKKTTEASVATNVGLIGLLGIGAIAAHRINENTADENFIKGLNSGQKIEGNSKNKEIHGFANYRAAQILKANPAIDLKNLDLHPLTPAERNSKEFMNRYKEILNYKEHHPELSTDRVVLHYVE